MKNKHYLRPGDLVLCISAICAAAAIIFFTKNAKGGKAEIMIEGKTVYSCDLSNARDEILVYGTVMIEIRDGKIGFIESDCFGRDCVKTGFISKPGETAACIPNRALIKITGSPSGRPDTVSY